MPLFRARPNVDIPSLSSFPNETNSGVFAYYAEDLGRTLTMDDLTTQPTSSGVLAAGTYTRKIIGPGTFKPQPGVILHQCLVLGSDGGTSPYLVQAGNQWVNGESWLYAYDTTFDGNGVMATSGVYPSGDAPSSINDPAATLRVSIHAERCDFKGTVDIIKPQGHVPHYFLDCFFHSPIYIHGSNPDNSQNSHTDMMQIAGSGATNVTIDHCHFKGRFEGPSGSRVVAISQWGGYIDTSQAKIIDVVIRNCYFDGGNYGFRVGSHVNDVPMLTNNLIIENNWFGLDWDTTMLATNSNNPTAQDGTAPTVRNNRYQASGTLRANGATITAGQYLTTSGW